MNRSQIQSLLLSGQPLKPDLFEFRADYGVFEDAGTDPAEDTDPVYQWSDQGPSGLLAAQATLANRPSLSSAATPNYLSFDGTDDRMADGGSTIIVRTSSAWTFEAWVRLTDFASSTAPNLLTLKSDTTHPYQIFFSNIVGQYLGVSIGSSTTWTRFKTDTAAASLIGADRHVIVTYNGAGTTTQSNFKIYIDSASATLSSASAFAGITNTTIIGSATSAGAFPWKGRIYKLAGFSRELTAGQVAARFALGVSG